MAEDGGGAAAAAFIARWAPVTGTERANYQRFIGELCGLLGVPLPGRRASGRQRLRL
jgi:hypothetical protein